MSLPVGDPPGGAPEMFEAVAGQRQVKFSWSPPPVTQLNGIIISYTLSWSPSPSSLPLSTSQSGQLTVPGFSPDTSYTCSVVASNRYGSGPATNTSFTTLEDCKTTIVCWRFHNDILHVHNNTHFMQIHICSCVLVEWSLVLK